MFSNAIFQILSHICNLLLHNKMKWCSTAKQLSHRICKDGHVCTLRLLSITCQTKGGFDICYNLVVDKLEGVASHLERCKQLSSLEDCKVVRILPLGESSPRRNPLGEFHSEVAENAMRRVRRIEPRFIYIVIGYF